MQKRHQDKKRYFREQSQSTSRFIVPYIESVIPNMRGLRVLEIGCGVGGNLPPFMEVGCHCTGVDLSVKDIELARQFMQEFHPDAPVKFIADDIYEINPDASQRYDLIIMRDVIEHIHDQDRFLARLKDFMSPQGKVFFGFPPWRMPFGGHQQVCENKVLSRLPYFHLLPASMYRSILRIGGEKEGRIESLLEIKETGISIQRFSRLIRKHGYTFDKRTLWLINPNYQVKFGLRPRRLWPILRGLPYVRDFYTTCCYAIVSQQSSEATVKKQ